MVYSINAPISSYTYPGMSQALGPYASRGYGRPYPPRSAQSMWPNGGMNMQAQGWYGQQATNNPWYGQSGDSYMSQNPRSRRLSRGYDDMMGADPYATNRGNPLSRRGGGYDPYGAMDEMDSWTSSRGPKPRHKAVGNDEFAEKAADTLYTILRNNPSLGRTLQDSVGLSPELMDEVQSTAHDPMLMRKHLYQVLADTPSGRKLQRVLTSNNWMDKLKQRAIKMAVQQATPDEYDKEVATWLKEFKETKPKPRSMSFDPFSSYGFDGFY